MEEKTRVSEKEPYTLAKEIYDHYRKLAKYDTPLEEWVDLKREVRMAFVEAVQKTVVEPLAEEMQTSFAQEAFPRDGGRGTCYYCLDNEAVREFACGQCLKQAKESRK